MQGKKQTTLNDQWLSFGCDSEAEEPIVMPSAITHSAHPLSHHWMSCQLVGG